MDKETVGYKNGVQGSPKRSKLSYEDAARNNFGTLL